MEPKLYVSSKFSFLDNSIEVGIQELKFYMQ